MLINQENKLTLDFFFRNFSLVISYKYGEKILLREREREREREFSFIPRPIGEKKSHEVIRQSLLQKNN